MNEYMPYLINWADALWIPAALFIVHKKQRIKAVLFILAFMLSLWLANGNNRNSRIQQWLYGVDRGQCLSTWYDLL